MQTILVCDDDKQIVEAINIYLTGEGFEVIKAYDGYEALELLATHEVNLMIVDVMMPGLDGIRTTLKVRETSSIPIIILSAKSEDTDKILGLNIGADDYITKPISLEVLVAKVQAMLRRSYDYETPPPEPRLRGAVLDAAGSCLMRGGERIPLTKNELGILQVLLERPGQVVRREAIMLRLWESDEFVDDNTLTVNVNRLRKTLAAAGIEDCVVTHKGQGYSINA